MSRRVIGLLAVALLAVLLAACAAPAAQAPTAPPDPPTATPAPSTATPAPPTATLAPPTATLAPPTATPAPPTATPLPERPEVAGTWVYLQDEGCDGAFDTAQDVIFQPDGQASSLAYSLGMTGPWTEEGDTLTVSIYAGEEPFTFTREGRGFTGTVGDFCLELRPAFPGLAAPSGMFFHNTLTLGDGAVLSLGGYITTAEKEQNRPNPSALRYDPAAAEWSSVADLGVERAGAVSVLLDDGRVLIAGGEALAEGSDPVVVLDPADGTITSAAPLGYPLIGASTALLSDGRVLVTGGQHPTGETQAYATAVIYDPAADAWAEVAPMPESRVNHRLTLLEDGRVLVTGGLTWDEGAGSFKDLSGAAIYDPAADSWAEAPAMGFTRQYHSAVRLADGRVLVVGGFNDVERVGTNVPAEIFDPASGAWSAIGLPPGDHSGIPAALLLDDGRVLVAGGGFYFQGNSKAVSVYDPAAETWAALAPMAFNRALHRLAPLPDGRVLLVGGVTPSQGTPSAHEIYNPADGGATVLVP